MRQVQAALSVAGDEHRVARLVWRHGVVDPHAAPAGSGPELGREIRTRYEPQVRLRFCRQQILQNRRVVAGEYHAAVPLGEVGRVVQMRGERADTARRFRVERRWKVEEGPVHVQEEWAVADCA